MLESRIRDEEIILPQPSTFGYLTIAMKKPSKIFKYEGINDHSLLNLKRSGVYFASPSEFNDPYDCNCGFKLEIEPSKLEDLRSGSFASQKGLPKEILNELRHASPDFFINAAKQALEIANDDFLKNGGIACFSRVNHNLLMWSHYASSFKGFCLEFDTNYEPFTKLYPVIYSGTLPTLDVSKILVGQNGIETEAGEHLKLFLTKSKDWHYEKEWRSIHKTKGTLFTYPQEALKSIYFGPLIDPAYREIICLVIQGQNRNVKFFKGDISKTSFKVEFTEFLYTPYIQAKESGLLDKR